MDIGTGILNPIVTKQGNTFNGALAITITGVAATTIRWLAKIETTEVV